MLDKPKGKQRFCWVCGASMGFIEDRFYDRRDSCGSRECAREERNAAYAEREEAHEQLDRDTGWGQMVSRIRITPAGGRHGS